MKVLLTGATGFLGSEVARELARQGHTLRLLVRASSPLDRLRGLEYEKVIGDITDPASLEAALDDRIEAVVHVAGHTSSKLRDRAAVRRVNLDGTRNLLELAMRKRPGIRIVHTSTIAAVGRSARPVLLDENATWDLAGIGYDYAESKRQGEGLALATPNTIVLSPGVVLGPGDLYLTSTKYVLEYLRGHNRFAVRGGLSFCDVREVARAHVTALTKGRAGERYILAGQNLTHYQAQRALYLLTRRYRPIPVPRAVLTVVGLVSDLLARVRPHALDDVTRAIADAGCSYFFYDVSKAKRELGYVVRPFDETVRDTLRDFAERKVYPLEVTAPSDDVAGGARRHRFWRGEQGSGGKARATSPRRRGAF